MHVLAVNSVSTLLNYLSEQLQNTPSLEEIQSWNREEIENIDRQMEIMKDKDREPEPEKDEDDDDDAKVY